ncbi:unnamed protein product [Cuscuta campestris]|uniref:Uncharacterized protein n=1 Tax=Cuscuta campestris TaxID=132261 RepID=A0A484KEK4_9ASTE|nr:unnamed protein product [Cuscuta campestris]
MEKMSKQTAHDRISNLAEPLLHHILSFLKRKDVVKTSALSKRWRYVWTSVPTLDFVSYSLSYIEHEYVAWVYWNLLRYQSTNVETLRIHFFYRTCFAKDVDTWIWFATERNVRDLGLRLGSGEYSLPQSLYSYSSLTNLSLSSCQVAPKGGIGWESLRSLSMDGVKLDEDTIAKLFLGCPRLEFLNFRNFLGKSRLDIRSDSLRELVIEKVDLPMSTTLEISAPKLQCLHIAGMWLEQVRLTDVPSLQKAKLKLIAETHGLNNIKLLESMHNVTKLELGLWEFQAILLSEVKPSTPMSPPFTCLKISKFNAKRDMFGIIALLRCLPNLETLIVNDIEQCYYPHSRESIYVSDIKVPLPCLKTVEFHGFRALEEVDKNTLKFTGLLLDNAEHLERVVINAGRRQMVVGPTHASLQGISKTAKI